MKKIGDWWIPDYDTAEKLKMISQGSFQCELGLLESFNYVKNFNFAIDVGTWIGDSSLIIAKKFKKIVLFEPVTEVAECCQKNLQQNGFSNFELHKIGLSNKIGRQVLVNKGKSFSGWISTVKSVEENAKRKFDIETNLLDNYNFFDVDFIKIDVDSHEGFLLQGAKTFFHKNNPVVMIESKKRDQEKYQDPNMPDPIKFLENLGYKTVKKTGKADYILTRY